MPCVWYAQTPLASLTYASIRVCKGTSWRVKMWNKDDAKPDDGYEAAYFLDGLPSCMEYEVSASMEIQSVLDRMYRNSMFQKTSSLTRCF